MKKTFPIVFTCIALGACANTSVSSLPSATNTPVSSVPAANGPAAFHVGFADETEIGEHTEFVLDPEEPDIRLAFLTDQAISDLSIVSLTYLETDQQGEILWHAETVYAQPALSPETPLVVVFPELGDIPLYGVEYTDTDGSRKSFSINVSGYDGSLILAPETFTYTWPENTTAEIIAEYAPDDIPEDFTLYVIGESETNLRILLSTDKTVNDLKIMTLSATDIDENGAIVWDKNIEATIPKFTPHEPLAIYAPNPGDLPSLGIEYTDIDGSVRFYVFSISGEDGSLLMTEE